MEPISLKDELLKAIRKDAISFRKVLADPEVAEALGMIGVLPKILELHAPSQKARRATGVGPTLCGIRGTRHADITCKRCLAKISR